MRLPNEYGDDQPPSSCPGDGPNPTAPNMVVNFDPVTGIATMADSSGSDGTNVGTDVSDDRKPKAAPKNDDAEAPAPSIGRAPDADSEKPASTEK